jgi:hypothetical protein
VDSQIGRRWLRELTYVEDGRVDIATRMQDEGYEHNDADDSIIDVEMPAKSKVDSDPYRNVMISPETEQRTLKAKTVKTSTMGPVERHNHLLKEAKSLAEVASRTSATTHVASLVLSTLTKAMTGHNAAELSTCLEALLAELPSMVGHGPNRIVKGVDCSYEYIRISCGLLILSMCWLSFIQNSRRRSSGTKKARCTGEAV